MTQDAVVTKIIDGNTAEVKIQRATACGDCESCGGTCSYRNVIKTTAVNRVYAAVGDRVTLESRTSKIIGAAVLVYIVPLVMFFLAYFTAAGFGLAENFVILTSLCGFFFGVLVVVLSQRGRKSKSITFEIIAIN